MSLVDPAAWRPAGIADLEPNAWTALRRTESTCVVAGPGAGKTEFLAQRATYLLQTGLCRQPFRILASSFKKKDAVENLAARVGERCAPEQARRFNSVTFDAFTKGLVDRFGRVIPEQWRPSRHYKITFPKKPEYDDFLMRARQSAPAGWRAEIAGIRVADFEAKDVGARRLTAPAATPTSGTELSVDQWWAENLRASKGCRLTFVMLNRLAELLLRSNPRILRALRLTYPFVFLDEFQDTTYAQYDFLQTAFLGSQSNVTAVGDDKQRIMTWAGAKVDAFASFTTDFQAQGIPLLFNYRSSPELVRVQYIVARALDHRAIEAQSRTERIVSGDVAQIWTFKDELAEAAQIAAWIAADMQHRGLAPRDYGILVRQTADRFEKHLEQPFAENGLGLRNESKPVGRMTLQDLLTEKLTHIATAIIRLATERRAPQAWDTAVSAVSLVRAAPPDDEVSCERAQAELLAFVKALSAELKRNPPSTEVAKTIAERVFGFLDMHALGRSIAEYALGDNLAIAREAFIDYLAASASRTDTWRDCLDAFEGATQIPLMTIHKSKGLEYDTVLFVGLDDKMWWSYSADNPEGVATFFVALSRAKQRVIFTYCSDRGQRTAIADLYALLTQAGVREVAF